jgi:hypothetical protein
MPPKSRRPETVKLPRGDRSELLTYLEHANPNHISAASWGLTWTATHGETRSSSQRTFHIGIRYANGRYSSCILVGTVQYGDLPVEGTVVDWGTTQPSLATILEHYQAQYNVTPAPTRPGPAAGPREDEDDNGGGAGGSSWKKEVKKDDYGGYYYIGEDEDYHECDPRGNEVQTTDRKTGYRTANPRGIVLVFENSQRQAYYYYHGKPKGCTLKKDSKTRTYYFVDDKGRDRDAQYVGSRPRWMDSKSASRGTAGRGGTAAYSSHASSSGSSHRSSGKSSARVQYLIDPASGRQYYVGSDGKTHWA